MNTYKTDVKSKVLWPVLFLMVMVKYAYYRYSYYPVLDDNNMYGFFRISKNIWKDVILAFGMYTTRPIAALLDPYFWAKFWDNLWIPLVIMTTLHFACCWLIYKIFEKSNHPIGIPAIVIFALLPFGSEATYWLAASTRIVVGLFFMLLSFYILYLYFDSSEIRYAGKKRTIFLVLFLVVHLISLGFYEQIIAMSFLLLPVLYAANWSRIKRKRIVLLPLLNFALIAFWYKFFGSTGNMAARGQTVQGGFKGLLRHGYDVTHAIYLLWRRCTSDLIKVGFPQGLHILLSNRSIVFLVLVIFLSVLAYSLLRGEAFTHALAPNAAKFLIGAYLFAVPMSPFYAISLIWIANRNIFLSFIGLGLMVEAVLNSLSRSSALTTARNILVSILVAALLVANVYELTYYRNVGMIDNEITTKISRASESQQEKPLVLFNAKSVYLASPAGRIENCTGSDWGLTGALYAQKRTALKMKDAFPAADQVFIPMKKDAVKASALLGIDDARNIFSLKTASESEDKLILVKDDGTEFGEVEFTKDGYMVFRVKRE